MRPAENIKRLVKNARIQINPEVKKSALKELINEFQKSKNTGLAGTKLNIWRIIMNSKITKLATVAVVILAIVVGVTLIDKSATPTYAIEQTIEAMRSISSVRAYISDGEVLFQINPETGQEECYRVDQEDVLTVATPEKTYYYYKDKNLVKISDEYIIGMEVRFSRFIEDMADWAQEHNGKMDHQLEFDQDLQKEVIKVHVSIPAQGDFGGQESTINVDPETKLPINFGSIRLEYNVPIPPGSFDFEIPEGAEVVYE
ncbi:MAG: hypothetical protein ACYSW3_23735 [Planctomycetota bacterium]|jgi:hypothetical protein